MASAGGTPATVKRTTFHLGNEDSVYVERARMSAAIKNSTRAKGRLRFTSKRYSIMFLVYDLSCNSTEISTRKGIYIDDQSE